jgi:hypothetical protein
MQSNKAVPERRRFRLMLRIEPYRGIGQRMENARIVPLIRYLDHASGLPAGVKCPGISLR